VLTLTAGFSNPALWMLFNFSFMSNMPFQSMSANKYYTWLHTKTLPLLKLLYAARSQYGISLRSPCTVLPQLV
jgi:hypothetical protein